MRKEIICVIFMGASIYAWGQNETDTVRTRVLDELEVSAVRNYVKTTPRGLKVSMLGNPLSDIGTAVDAIKQMPLIEATDNGIVVAGKGSPAIYINGRLMRDSGELDMLTSKDLDSVEIITMPSVKYGPEVTSVILIRTKKRNSGIYAGAGTTLTVSSVMSESFRGNVGTQSENGLNLFGDFSFSDSRFKQTRRNSEIVAPVDGSTTLSSNTQGKASGHSESLRTGVGLNYDFHNHSIGAKYTFSRTLPTDYRSRYVTLTNMRDIEEINSDNHISSSDSRHYLNFYSYFTLSGKTDLRLDLDYLRNRSGSSNRADENGDEAMIRNHGSMNADLCAGKVELEKSMEKLNFMIGGDYTYTKNNQLFINSSTGDVPEILESATDVVTQNLYSGYLTFDWKVTDRWSVDGGLRYDATTTRYVRNGVFEKSLSKEYGDWIPNLGISYIGDFTVTLRYKQAVYRPSYSSLDNNYTYSTPTQWSAGNPQLQKVKTHEIDLNVNYKKFMFQVQGTRYFHKIGYSSRYEPLLNATVSQMVNLPSYNALQLVAVQRLDVSMWHPVLQGVAVFQDLTYGNPKHSYKTPLWQMALNNRFDLPKGVYAWLNFFVRGNGDIELQTCKAWWQTSLTLSKTYRNWTFSLSANDIFGSWKYDILTKTNNVVSHDFRKGGSQTVSITVNYQFKASKSKYKGKAVRDDEINRL